MAETLKLPSEKELIAGLAPWAEKEESIALCLAALETGEFKHPDGRVDELGVVRLLPGQAGLLAHLAALCPTPLSIEIGFGMGSSAAIILGVRRLINKPFSHLIFDPYGLFDGAGTVVQDYLKARFPKAFQRIMKTSEVGLALVLNQRGAGSVGLIFIDGGHLFENVMVDFYLADQLCCVGGFIVLDDAWYPAIETAINYIIRNRPNYAVAHLAVPNCTVLKKLGPDKRSWDSFKPFEVPDREDWEPVKPRRARAR